MIAKICYQPWIKYRQLPYYMSFKLNSFHSRNSKNGCSFSKLAIITLSWSWSRKWVGVKVNNRFNIK